MVLNNLIKYIKNIAYQQIGVYSVCEGFIEDNWGKENVKYGSVHIALRNFSYNVNNDSQQMVFSFILYYGDRLTENASNRISIWTDGFRVLQSIVNTINEDDKAEVLGDITYEPFYGNQFSDKLAGVYANVDIRANSELGLCSIEEMEPPTPPQPEPFDIEGYTFVDGTVLYSAAALTKKDKILSINDTTITEIGDGGYAFAGCKLLETITLPNLTRMAGTYNFYTLPNLREVNLPALTAQSNGTYTYYGCVKLERVNLPNLTSVQSTSSMFSGCENLLEINTPKLGNAFGSSALTGCNKLRKLDITSSNNFPSLPTGFTDLIEVHFGSGQYLNMALNLSRWNPTNAYLTDSQSLLTPEDIQAGFTSNAEKLYYNLQHYFADLLPNRTGSSAGSMTLNADMKTFINAQIGLGIKNTIENKNWIIA